jgi:16S rRNA processing protein RimM
MKKKAENNASNLEDFISVARIARTRGLKGELVADLLTDFPERFEQLDSLLAIKPSGEREQLTIEEHWFQRNRIILKFGGYDSIEAAKTLVGSDLVVPESERVALGAGEYYDWQLAGCVVQNTAGTRLGRVREVMRTGGVEMLVIESEQGREILIPMAREICLEIDIAAKSIRVDPPEGLLDL